MITSRHNFIGLNRVLEAIRAPVWLVHSPTYVQGCLMTNVAYNLFKAVAEPSELETHIAELIPKLEPYHDHFQFVGSLEIKNTFKLLSTK